MWSVVSSCAVPAGERFDWYADIISREVMPAALSSERPAEFQGEAAVLDLGDLRVAKFALSPLRSRRTPALIRRGDPEQYQLALLREGSTSMSQHRNDCTIGAGDLMLWDTSRPSDNEMLADRGQARATILMLPREALPLRDQRPELTPPVVAARHNISLRTLHQLFHGQGESVRARIRRRRLEQCRADLARPGPGAHRVHAIAARWGFSGPVVFSRSFREAYGVSPAEFRALSLEEAGAERAASRPAAAPFR
ncbi:helix-turn-helix domain-containing protein [Streptomyces sp. NBC_00435]|uniref:AraC-like ligand-binding domain-containing protein n=1 Tax=Streptomyces sp. NBC_00435 TaxID=2903649 RepID=UPI002E218D9E